MKKQNAFTLAELLVSILIISVILTLLAPVITKRVVNSSSITNSSSGSNINYNSQLFTYNLSDSACTQSADSENSLKCSFVVPSKARTLNALVVSGGGGGAGAAQPNIEYGKTAPKEEVIQSVCAAYGVNESWLRTGEGEIFKPVSKDAELAAFLGEIMHGETADFRRRLVAALARFGPDEWELLERMVNHLAEEIKKED